MQTLNLSIPSDQIEALCEALAIGAQVMRHADVTPIYDPMIKELESLQLALRVLQAQALRHAAKEQR